MVSNGIEHDNNLLPPLSVGLAALMNYADMNASGSQELLKSSAEEYFNFSLQEAYQILKEHQQSDRNLVPDTEIILILIYSVLMTSGVVSNALVCFVVIRQCSKKTISSSGPTPRNLYIVNLAIADIALCLICMPFTLVSLLRRRWTLGVVLCKMVPVVQGANIMVSAGTITAIALDRYFTIVRSPRSQVCQGPSCSVAATITLLWTLSFATMLPLLVYQDVEVVTLGELVLYEACVERWPSKTLQCVYTVALSVFQFLIPVLVLSTIHAKISAYLSVHLSTPPRDSTCKRARREWRRNRRTMIILSCIAVVFAISWLPMTTFTVVMELNPTLLTSPRTLYLVFAVCHILAMSSACTNPLLYGWLNTNFRRELGAVLGRDKQSAQPRNHNRLNQQRQSIFFKGDRRISMTFFTTLTTATTSHRSGASFVHGTNTHGQGKVEHV